MKYQIILDVMGEEFATNEQIEVMAAEFATEFKCTSQLIQHNGPAGGASVFEYVGEKEDLMRLCREYDQSGDNDDLFNEYAEVV